MRHNRRSTSSVRLMRVFLPEGIDALVNGEEDNVLQSYTEISIKDQIFEETIAYSNEYDTVRVYANNITQRCRAEQAANAKSIELIQTQEFIEAVTRGTDVIIATVDSNFCYTYFNQAYQEELKRLSGIDIKLGMSMLDAFAQLPEQQKIVKREWGQVLHGKSTNKVLEFGDPSLYQKVFNVLHTPIRDQEGNVVGAGEVAFNITEQVRAQVALQESEARFPSGVKKCPGHGCCSG